jgi:hypothetical protein
MKQFWTPLARMLGMVDPAKTTDKAHQGTHDFMDSQAPLTQWLLLFNALRQEADQVWCARNLQHAEVNPDEILAVTAVSIQAGNKALDEQLRTWFMETDASHLIQWMVNGPFNTEKIRAHVNFDAFTGLQVLDLLHKDAAQANSAYSKAAYLSTPAVFHIQMVSRWVPRPPPAEIEPECQPLDILVCDASGERRLHVHHPLVILGASEIHDSKLSEKPGAPSVPHFSWQGEPAQFICIHAQYVSGFHMMLRSHAQGFEIEDMGSTNGSYLRDQRLPEGQTVSSVLPLSLTLGGPSTDPMDLTAIVQIAIEGTPRQSRPHATPLRQVSVVQPKLPNLSLLVMDGLQETRVGVAQFPFEIGRDLDADLTISAEHVMVSRRHLVLTAFDMV